MATVRMYDIRWVSHTAGPSPVTNEFGPNCRVELFLMGCKKAQSGYPCKGCFNPKLWSDSPARELEAEEIAIQIEKFAPQKYITIVGGEPFDQPEGLTELCEALKRRDFHIMVFTHYRLKDFREWQQAIDNSLQFENVPDTIHGWTRPLLFRFLKAIDILVDGEYIAEERIYDEDIQDGFHNAVGSGNQIIWDLKAWRDIGCTFAIRGLAAKGICTIALNRQNSLVYLYEHNFYNCFHAHLGTITEGYKGRDIFFRTPYYLSSFDRFDYQEKYYESALRYLKDSHPELKDEKDIALKAFLSWATVNKISKDIIKILLPEFDNKNFFIYDQSWLNPALKQVAGHFEEEEV